jgi:hypothetical protein
MARGTINTAKLLEGATKIRDKTAKQIFALRNEIIAANKAIERGNARLLSAGAKYDELLPAHEQNNAAVVALGGEALDEYVPPVVETDDESTETDGEPVDPASVQVAADETPAPKARRGRKSEPVSEADMTPVVAETYEGE